MSTAGIYSELSDEEVVLLAQGGDSRAYEFILTKYKNFIKSKAHAYFLIGADREDIVQEGMIGLFKAVRDYRNDKQASFRVFAELCVVRQIITAIKTATRQKHMPLNTYVSLNRPIYDEESDRTFMDIITVQGKVSSPEEMLINHEDYLLMETEITGMLSDLEKKVLALYLAGKSYQEIAVELDRHVKSIDNALQRIKRKLEKHLESREN